MLQDIWIGETVSHISYSCETVSPIQIACSINHAILQKIVNIPVGISDMWVIVLTHVTPRSLDRGAWPKRRFSHATAQRLHHVPLGRQGAVVSTVC